MFFVSANKFGYLVSKKHLHTPHVRQHSTCIEDKTCGTKCRIVSLLFPLAKLGHNKLKKFQLRGFIGESLLTSLFTFLLISIRLT